MKRFLIVFSLILAFACGVATQDSYAQQRGKKKHKTQWVKKNAKGFADPTGHTYKYSDAGIDVTLEFTTPEIVVMTMTRGDKSSSTELKWSQNEDMVDIDGFDPVKISPNGRTLTEGNGKTCKIVK